MYEQRPFDPGNGKVIKPGFTQRPGSTMGMRVDGEEQPDYYKKQGQIGQFRGQSIEDMRAGGAFDYQNEGYVGGYAMDQMSDKGTVRVQRGQFMSDVDADSKYGKEYLRNVYSDRYQANKKAKQAAIEAEQVGYDYTDPHTGEVFKAKSGYVAPQSDMPAVDVTPQMQVQRDPAESTFDIRNSNAQGQGVDWQKVDAGRRQRAANTAKYGLTDRQSNRFQRQQTRAKKRMQRQQRRETRRRERQIRRRNEGGFLRRLFT